MIGTLGRPTDNPSPPVHRSITRAAFSPAMITAMNRADGGLPMRRLLTIVLVVCGMLAATTGPAGASAPGARVLTVLSFNIHHAQGSDDVLDLQRIARVIRDSGADVVGLQEVDRHYSARSDWADQAGELAALLGYHVVFGANIDRDPPAADRPRIQYGTAILSRFPITDWANTHLFRSPNQEQRGLLHAELDVRGVPVHVYNTHLAASSQTDRAEQTRQIVELIGDTTPAVLVGDLNALPGAPEIETLDAAFTDAWTAAGIGGSATYPAETPDRRIDYVYTGDRVRPVWTRVLHIEPAASDHLPVASRVVVSPRT
ncbi:endonuclease/exonuclease/phosphatase family protein [Saccharomonospora sp. NPDC046836]|uniref:endonuclease/exonuclease/phosphatase family protein n=1 Tax=Saccharomonospora sp. NPDC046836 TaxID=3156921 RepID=UPI0033E22772